MEFFHGEAFIKRLGRVINNFWQDERGITGLETAIVLIAFVVVAAVFAFTVLTTGLFATEKAKASSFHPFRHLPIARLRASEQPVQVKTGQMTTVIPVFLSPLQLNISPARARGS